MDHLILASIMCPTFTCEPPERPCAEHHQESEPGLAIPPMPLLFGASTAGQPLLPSRSGEPLVPTIPGGGGGNGGDGNDGGPGADVVPEPSSIAIVAVLALAGAVGVIRRNACENP